ENGSREKNHRGEARKREPVYSRVDGHLSSISPSSKKFHSRSVTRTCPGQDRSIRLKASIKLAGPLGSKQASSSRARTSLRPRPSSNEPPPGFEWRQKSP